jgi:hypothetical protein
MRGQVKFSSRQLNMQSGNVRGLAWHADGSKYLSPAEQELVQLAVHAWATSGANALVDIPDCMDRRVRGGCIWTSSPAAQAKTVPVQGGCAVAWQQPVAAPVHSRQWCQPTAAPMPPVHSSQPASLQASNALGWCKLE